MPRVLTRAAALQAHRGTATLEQPTTVEPGDGHTVSKDVRAGDRRGDWFGRPVDDAERERLLQAATQLMLNTSPLGRSDVSASTDAQRALLRLLAWLDSFSGNTYQDRWSSSRADTTTGDWYPELAAGLTRRTAARRAINAVILLGAIRPSANWMFANKQARFWRDWTTLHEPAAWDRYFQVAEAAHASGRRLWSTAAHLIRISITTGLPVSAIRGADVVTYADFLRSNNRSTGDLHTMWHFARQAGLLAGEPADFTALTLRGPRTPTELVDRYEVRSPRVRRLLIDYLTEMSTSRDYGSLEGGARNLVQLFWRSIETANPGIDTINLTKAQAAAWKRGLVTKPDGKPRHNADSVMGAVRSFYLDLAAWAHEDPATWAEWAVPCPVSVRDVRGGKKRRRQREHRMQARTRSLAPHLIPLAAAAARRYREAVELRDTTLATPVGTTFELHGRTYVRSETRRGSQHTAYVVQQGRDARLDTEWLVVKTFMTGAIVDVLRHTGVRVEELVELTHLSIRQYRRPDGTILPLLQIAPGKTDEERIVPCSPELTATLARLITFVSLDGAVPLCTRRDIHELTFSAPMPFLFQLREAGRSRVMSYATVRSWLIELANDAELRDHDGQTLAFTAHDFRRLFITDIVNAGFPIHLAARLVGHKNIEVTRGYTAVYQQDVFDAYGRFIEQRRRLRPASEYREPTQQEWAEFVEHFGQRKIALGTCRRPYGADCVHEHACIRCDFLQIDPAQAQRLHDIRANLVAQVEEAKVNQWLGDVTQLRLTIEHADRKAAQFQEILAGPGDHTTVVFAQASSAGPSPEME